MSASDASNAPTTFTPVSVSAVGVSDYWVLGYNMTRFADGLQSGGATVLHTDDGGKSFAAATIPGPLVPDAPISLPPQAVTVANVRFGDATHGWAYGNSLYETDDAGATWRPVTTLPGEVVDLAALRGSVWAVVGETDPTGGASTFAVYQATFSAAEPTGAWHEVQLPVKPDQPPSIAVQGSNAYLLAAAGNDGRLLQLTTDGKVSAHAAPCTFGLPGRLSAAATPGVFWATCATGTMASIFVTADSGKAWTQVPVEASNAAEVGGISATTATLADNTGPVETLHADGRKLAIAVPDRSAGADFIGFTTSKVGFVLARSTNTTALWRTTDGGASWSVVSLPMTSG